MKVAVLDSGIDPNHDLFQGHIAADGYDFVDEDSEPWEESNGINDDGDDTTDEGFDTARWSRASSSSSRRTPRSFQFVSQMTRDGRTSTDHARDPLCAATGRRRDEPSFGSPRQLLDHAVGKLGLATDLGIVIVAGAGNENREDPPYYPGESSKTVMVTALDSVDVKASFADWNQKVLVSAPGDG
ncbi:MAG: S8 family serine peptidase [Candidatus Eisenbacteria bacterium]